MTPRPEPDAPAHVSAALDRLGLPLDEDYPVSQAAPAQPTPAQPENAALPPRVWIFEDALGGGGISRGGAWIDEQSECPEGSREYVSAAELAKAQASRDRLSELHHAAARDRDCFMSGEAAQKNRADKAETERGAMVGAVILEVWGRCEELEDEAYTKQETAITDHERGFWSAQKTIAKRLRRSIEMPATAIAALDRAKADARAEGFKAGMLRAAEVASALDIGEPESEGDKMYDSAIRASVRAILAAAAPDAQP